MGVSTSDALYAAASCNTLLSAIDRLDALLADAFSDPEITLPVGHYARLQLWTTDARETVLDIKSRL